MSFSTTSTWTEVVRKQCKPKEKTTGTPAPTPDERVTALNRGKRKKKRKAKPFLEAFLIKPTGIRTYAEELGEIRSRTKPENSDAEVRSIRQTRSGDSSLGAGIKDKTVFRDTLINILGDKATVRQLDPRITLEIRDLDSLTINQKVEEAIGRNLSDLTGDLKV